MCRINAWSLCIAILICCISLPVNGISEYAHNDNLKSAYDAVQLSKPQQHNINHLTEMYALRKQQQQKQHKNSYNNQLLQQRHDRIQSNALTQQQQQQMHTKSYDKNSDIISGHDVAHTNATTTAYNTNKLRAKRQLNDFLIVPNTRWCGRGNTANGTYNHLGGASMADKCCRRHDNCNLYIPGLSNRYDLFNYRPYTLSHCSCDRRFHTCLKLANDDDARTIGKLFFNMVQTQCFILRNEKVCQQRDDDGSCLQEIVKQKAYLKPNKKF